MRRAIALLLLYVALSGALLTTLGTRVTGYPPLGSLLDPLDGFYRTARHANDPPPPAADIPQLEGIVQIEWDGRGVPHIFAENDLDAVRALGYVVAHDRLFQLDFLPRAASGRLAEALGPAAISSDRFLRRTGMDRAAKENLQRIESEAGEELEVLHAFAEGVNAYLARLEVKDLPFEFRLLGYRPDPWSPLQTLRLLQYMNYDLTYGSDRAASAVVQARLSPEDFDLLYRSSDGLYVPIIPSELKAGTEDRSLRASAAESHWWRDPEHGMSDWPLLQGFFHGKGSNNWAVAPARSSMGHVLLANDMHLSVSLPAIWYEVQMVTPTMNSYGVTIPGAPLPVAAFNTHVAWGFTNTGSDQIDHYALQLDSTEAFYLYEDEWHELELVIDTIFVHDSEPIVDTVRYAHWGPLVDENMAIQWTAHKPSTTLSALLAMNRATNRDEFDRAIRSWGTPMQNIIYGDVEGNIGIRSAGYMPLRRSSPADGLLDGSTGDFEWSGRVPFEDLPHALNPYQGFLTSTNQRPRDSTYGYYLGNNWQNQYRSLRIDSLLRGRPVHSAEDVARYQSDVVAMQYQLFFPLIDTLSGLSSRGNEFVDSLRSWDGAMTSNRMQPRLLDVFLDQIERLTWDEPEFRSELGKDGRRIRAPRPSESRLYTLLRERPGLPWFDIVTTPIREDAAGLLRAAVEASAARLDGFEGRWGDYRKVVFRHMLGTPALAALGRGPFEYPGYRDTLSPAPDSLTTHTASWRVVVDFSSGEPEGRGVYPGGQRGNPFSRLYDAHLPAFVAFEYYDLLKPRAPGELDEVHLSGRTRIHPPEDKR